MKKIYYGIIAGGLLFIITGCTAGRNISRISRNEIYSLNADKACTVRPTLTGITKILKKAQQYNSVAKHDGVEFVRHKITTTKLIKIAHSELKKSDLKNANMNAYKACVWSIRGIQQEKEPDYKLN